MMKPVLQRLCAMVLSAMMILSLLPTTAIPVFAAELTGMPTGLSATIGDKGTWKIASTDPFNITGTVSGTGSCSGGATQSTSIVLTNSSGGVRSISFDYSVTIVNSGSCKLDGATIKTGTDEQTVTHTGTIERSMTSGSTISFDLTTAKGTSSTTTINITNLTYTAPPASDITFQVSEGGSYTANGTSVIETTVINAEEIAVAATPASGYDFLAWVDVNTGKQLSSAASCTLAFSAETTVKPIFTNAAMSAWYLVDSVYLFDDLTVAADKANSTIVVIHDGVLSAGNYTIPSGVTLLVPFDSTNTLYYNEPEYIVDANEGGTNWSKPTFYRTLTMAQGAHITVNGAISLSAKHSAQFGYNGMPIGNVSRINMNSGSSITLNSGGALYAWGYITGFGSVTAKSGATVYESFQLKDWRGGSQTMGMKNRVFPMSQYYFQNIEVPLTIESGATEYGITTASLSIVGNQRVAIALFAPSNALFKLTSGSVTKDFIESEDLIAYNINGDLTISSYTLELSSAYKIKTSNYSFPIPSHFKMHAESGNITLNQDITFYPGSEFVIDSGVTMSVGSGYGIYIYDSEQWGNYCYYGGTNVPMVALDYAPGRTCAVRSASSLGDATFCVNGTLSGNVYTSEGGANVYSTGSGSVIQATSANATIHQIRMNLNGTENDEYDAKTFVPAVLKHGDGTDLKSVANTFNYDGARWVCATHTTPTDAAATCTTGVNCTVCGSVAIAPLGHEMTAYPEVKATCTTDGNTAYWQCTREGGCGSYYSTETGYAEDGTTETKIEADSWVTKAPGHTYDEGKETTPATCTASGVKTFTCSDCHAAYTETVAALGHDEVAHEAKAPTCTETGWDAYVTCSRCDYTTYAEKAALGHDEVEHEAKAPTCTEIGWDAYETCSRCDYTTYAEKAALGHDEVEHEAKAPTCTAIGWDAYETCSRCDYSTYAEKAALGHDEVEHEAKAPTCTAIGWDAYETCSRCDYSTYAEKAALGHDEITHEAKAPTCTAIGWDAYETCSRCDYTTYAEKAALGHDEISHEAKAPTCTAIGWDAYVTCSRCDYTTYEEKAATGVHIYENGVCTGCGDPEPSTGIEINVEIVGTANKAEVTGPADGWKEGTNTFYVSNDLACVVVISYDKGETYQRLPATADGARYKFTAENVVVNTIIKVLVQGDVNGNGTLDGRDVANLRKAILGTLDIGKLGEIAGDLNGNNSKDGRDVANIRKAILGTHTIVW